MSMLYILSSYEENVYNTCIKWVIIQWGISKKTIPTTWDADWYNYSTANYIVIALDPSPCWIHKVVFITEVVPNEFGQSVKIARSRLNFFYFLFFIFIFIFIFIYFSFFYF